MRVVFEARSAADMTKKARRSSQHQRSSSRAAAAASLPPWPVQRPAPAPAGRARAMRPGRPARPAAARGPPRRVRWRRLRGPSGAARRPSGLQARPGGAGRRWSRSGPAQEDRRKESGTWSPAAAVRRPNTQSQGACAGSSAAAQVPLSRRPPPCERACGAKRGPTCSMSWRAFSSSRLSLAAASCGQQAASGRQAGRGVAGCAGASDLAASCFCSGGCSWVALNAGTQKAAASRRAPRRPSSGSPPGWRRCRPLTWPPAAGGGGKGQPLSALSNISRQDGTHARERCGVDPSDACH